MVLIIIQGSVILVVNYFNYRLKNVQCVLYTSTKQTVSEKVNGQKGNSPNRWLKFQNVIKEKTKYY